ncbi:DUF3391 domain-containing protein [Methylobacillus sp. Pita1]
MLKKIPVSQLRIGMFIHKLDISGSTIPSGVAPFISPNNRR